MENNGVFETTSSNVQVKTEQPTMILQNYIANDLNVVSANKNIKLYVHLDNNCENIENVMIGSDSKEEIQLNKEPSEEKYQPCNFDVCLDNNDKPEMITKKLHPVASPKSIRKHSLQAPRESRFTKSYKKFSLHKRDDGSRTPSPIIKRKIDKKRNKFGFSHNDNSDVRNKMEGSTQTVLEESQLKHRKYSLPFFKWDKRNSDEKVNCNLHRSNSTVAIETPVTIEYQLDYDLSAMRKKSCIALTNTIIKKDEGFEDYLEECTNLVKAIEIAAFTISEKEKKKRKRKQSKDLLVDDDSDSLMTTLDECKSSELLICSVNRLDTRRSGISERCEVERLLVKQSVKYLIQNEFITLYKD